MRSAPARLVFAGGDLLAYTREHAGGRLLIGLNLVPQPQVPEQLPHRRSAWSAWARVLAARANGSVTRSRYATKG